MRLGKNVSLTEQGESLTLYARQILRLNDIAIARFEPRNKGEVIRVGLPLDYAVNLLQEKLTEIIIKHPDLRIEIRCDLSRNLIELLQHGLYLLLIYMQELPNLGKESVQLF